MDIRRSIKTMMWSDSWFETLSPEQKLLWVYLLTNGYTNMLGIYQVSIKRIVFETGLTESSIKKSFAFFENSGRAFYLLNEWVFLPNWIKNQSMNPNMLKSANDDFDNLPNELIDCLLTMGFEGFESLSKGLVILLKKEKEIESEKEDKKEYEDQKIQYGSVYLSDPEYANLYAKFGKEGVEWMVDKLNNYKLSTGKKYKSDYRAILNWVVDSWEKQPKKEANKDDEWIKKHLAK